MNIQVLFAYLYELDIGTLITAPYQYDHEIHPHPHHQ